MNTKLQSSFQSLNSPVPDSSCVCVALKVLLPALVMVVMETESGGRVRRMRMGVGVRAGREAARAGRSGARVGDRARPRARAWILKERAVLLSAGTAEGGVEVTVLAAKRRGLERGGGGGRGERGGKVPLGQPLGVCDSWGGRGGGGLGEVPQGAVLFDHPSVLARSICPLDGERPLLLLLHFRQPILECNIVISICCEAVTVAGGCEGVLPVADWWTCVRRGVSIGTERMVPSITEGQRVAARITQGHGPLPAGLAGTLSLLCESKTREQRKRRRRLGSLTMSNTLHITCKMS